MLATRVGSAEVNWWPVATGTKLQQQLLLLLLLLLPLLLLPPDTKWCKPDADRMVAEAAGTEEDRASVFRPY